MALIHIGASAEADDVGATLHALYDRLAPDGIVVIDDAASAANADAIDTFRAANKIATPVERFGG